jgi:hypothetical protein
MSPLLALEVPPAVLTWISTVPVPAGLVAVKDVSEFTVREVAAVEPNSTVDPDVNPVPVRFTTVPPANGPSCGLVPVTVGTGS